MAQDDEAKAKAEDIRAKIVGGRAVRAAGGGLFGFGSKANGGLVGPLAKTDLSEDLQKAIAGLKTGGVTPGAAHARAAIRSSRSKTSPTRRPSPSTDARSEIADKIANGKRQGEYRKFIAKLRAEAIIDWKNDEIKKAYEVGLQAGSGRALNKPSR